MARIAVVANAGCRPDVRAIAKAFEGHGPADVHVVAGEGLEAAGREALEAGAEVLVAAGGDGTVSGLAGVAVAHGAPFGVLPLGTLNHFAKDAGIPLALEDAARAAATGTPRPVDVGMVGERVFVNNASVGLYPRAVRERDRLQERGASKPLATAAAAVTVLRQVPAHHLRLSLDGRAAERVTSVLLVGNNAYGTTVGELGRRASLHHGRLSVYTVRRPGRRAVLGLAARALLNRLDQAEDFEADEAASVVVETASPTLRIAIDGEVARMATPLRFRIRPGALRLVGEASA